MAQVLLQHVSKTYPGNVAAVREFSLEIPDREFMVFVGPSGCGKSTTLRMIAGLEEISEGVISIGDRVVNDVPPKDRDVAMVFQNYALYPHMTVYQNMAFGLKLRKTPREEMDRRIREAADLLGIQDLLARKPKALSGGQRQRVAVGRAIVRQPQAFLFDEPLSNLDAKLRVQMRMEISRLHHTLQSTMIYVTHDQVEAMTMGDRIVVMNEGVMQQVDTPMNIYARPANRFVAGFIGSPAMNFFEGELVQEGETLWFRSGEIAAIVDPGHVQGLSGHGDRKVMLGLRPERIRMVNPEEANPAHPSAVTCVVDLAEPMGGEVHLHLRSGDHLFRAKVDGAVQARQGDALKVGFDMAFATYFEVDGEGVRIPLS